MDTEILKIFDEQGRQIGTAARDEAHKKGLWHETFQVYFIDVNPEGSTLYLQQRSHRKKDFPRLFDMTVAGHLMEHESVHDGVREIEEEVGIHVSIDELIYLGKMKNIINTNKIADKEFSHVFLYECKIPLESFSLQKEEVDGMVKVDLHDFIQFYYGKCNQLTAEGFMIDQDGKKAMYTRVLSKDEFVPHSKEYTAAVAEAMNSHLSGKLD